MNTFELRSKILKILYERWKKNSTGDMMESKDLIRELGIDISLKEMEPHIDFLEERLLIDPEWVLGGFHVQLTPFGIDLIKDNRESLKSILQ